MTMQIKDMRTPTESMEAFTKLVDRLVARLRDSKVVIIHCNAGKGRSGNFLSSRLSPYSSLPFLSSPHSSCVLNICSLSRFEIPRRSIVSLRRISLLFPSFLLSLFPPHILYSTILYYRHLPIHPFTSSLSIIFL